MTHYKWHTEEEEQGADLKTIVGQFVLLPDGSWAEVRRTFESSPTGVHTQSVSVVDPKTGQAIRLPAGAYTTQTGKMVSLNHEGDILDQRTLTQTERNSLLGESGSTHVPQPYGYTAPDPMGVRGASEIMLGRVAGACNASHHRLPAWLSLEVLIA